MQPPEDLGERIFPTHPDGNLSFGGRAKPLLSRADKAVMSPGGYPAPVQSADVPLISPLMSAPGQLLAVPRIIEALKGAVDTLRAQLKREHNRADRAEQRIDDLEATIADAIGAERIAAGEAAALRAELNRRREWRLLRRLRWALRGDRQ